jgi:non-ribosomal peptide synthetase component F
MEGLRSAVWKGTSWSVLMIATTAAYLQRMTGLHDVVVGLSVAARPNPITQHIPGMASNVLPIRIDVRTAKTATELVRQTSQMIHQAIHHQRYRREDLIRELRPSDNEQILSGPEISVMSLGYDVRFAGHPVTAHNIANGPVEDLKIIVYDRRNQQRVRVDFDANSELYSADELANHQQRYVRLLEAVVADPDQPVSRIGLLSAQERHRLLAERNSTAHPMPHASLPPLFEAQVAATPQALAVVSSDASLTYAELNARANRLAHALIARGVGTEQIVALARHRQLVRPDGIVNLGGAW